MKTPALGDHTGVGYDGLIGYRSEEGEQFFGWATQRATAAAVDAAGVAHAGRAVCRRRAKEGVGFQRFLLRPVELEVVEREQRAPIGGSRRRSFLVTKSIGAVSRQIYDAMAIRLGTYRRGPQRRLQHPARLNRLARHRKERRHEAEY